MRQCPLCKGKGMVGKPSSKQEKIIEMRKNGASYREIMRRLGFNSSSVIQYHLKQWNKYQEQGKGEKNA